MASPSPGPGVGGKPAGSLAAWKSGADKMTTAAAGDHVAKTAPKQQRPKSTVRASSKPPPSTKPWAEQSVEERYGTQQKVVNISKQLKDVLRYLEAHQDRQNITWQEIITQGIPHWYDTAEGGELYNLLTHNNRVHATAVGFTYQSEHGITDKASLLAFIRAHPEGVRSSDIKDGYENVLQDADKLHAEGSVYKLYNAEFKVDVFFAVPQVHNHTVSQDLIDTYLKTELPSEAHELVAALQGMKMRSTLAGVLGTREKQVSLMKQEKPKKKKRKLNLRHMTNTHMANLLADNQFTSID